MKSESRIPAWFFVAAVVEKCYLKNVIFKLGIIIFIVNLYLHMILSAAFLEVTSEIIPLFFINSIIYLVLLLRGIWTIFFVV